jgi:hypothetical protein
MSQLAAEFDAIRALIAEHGPRDAERILALRHGPVRVVRCAPSPAAQPCRLNDYTAQPREHRMCAGSRARRTSTEGFWR